MSKERRHFSPEDQVQILREHLIEKKPVSEVSQKHKLQPTLFHLWQKPLFESGPAAFERTEAPRRTSAEQQKTHRAGAAKVGI